MGIMTVKPKTTRDRRERRIKVVVVAISIIASLAIGEVALRLLTPFPITKGSNQIDDPRLGYRLSPALDDVDEHGFRNEHGAWENPEIIAIGDSHTYGFHVAAEDSWPTIFSQASGLNTYNYGTAGYNLFMYHALVSEAVERDVGGIIIGLYPSNDFVKNFKYCKESGDFDYWRKQIADLQLDAPKDAEECGLSSRSERQVKTWEFPNLAFVSAVEHLFFRQLITANTRHSRFFSNLSVNVNNIRYLLGMPEDGAVQDQFFRFPGGVMPLKKSRIDKAGQRGREMLPDFGKLAASWYRNAKSRDIKLGVLIIPGRAQVIYRYLEKEQLLDQTDPDFMAIAQEQNRFEEDVKEILGQIGIPYVDALDEVVDAFDDTLTEGGVFYPSTDTHPLENGYHAYGHAAVRLWREMSDGQEISHGSIPQD